MEWVSGFEGILTLLYFIFGYQMKKKKNRKENDNFLLAEVR